MIRSLVVAALLAVATPALAQGMPEGLRGSWFAPDCADPRAMLHVTARAAATLPLDGRATLLRFVAIGETGGWTVGTGSGADAPRMGLRREGDRLDTVTPNAKLRDDRLPGDAPTMQWVRCPAPPAGFGLLHGEGLAFLGMLERIEAACAGPGEACLEAVVAIGDLSGDGLLSVAELARMMRGASWVLTAQEGPDAETVALSGSVASVAGLLTARLVVDSLDYDGDGQLSGAELRQDRAPLPSGAGDAAGRPVRTEGVSEGAGFLRALMEGLIMGRSEDAPTP